MVVKSKLEKRDAVHLPAEVTCIIMYFVKLQKKSQSTLHSCCQVSRSWYYAAIVLLYQSPVFGSTKFPLFIRTMRAPKNIHGFRSPLLKHVKTLDLAAWTYIVRPYCVEDNVTEKLLRKVGGGLDVFVAPYTHSP
jgi:hypothetical protein